MKRLLGVITLFFLFSNSVNDIDINIIANIRNSNDILKLLLVTNAIRNLEYNYPNIHLTIPYFPYARQDKIFVEGEAFSVKAMTELINFQMYESVSILDPHSQVVYESLENCNLINAYTYIDKTINDIINLNKEVKTLYFVAPDKGAIPRLASLCQFAESRYPDKEIKFIGMKKIRDSKTKEVINLDFDILPDVKDYSDGVAIVFDDICETGSSLEDTGLLLDTLNFKNKYTYVSHGIFSKGSYKLLFFYNKIYTTDSFYKEDRELHGVKTWKLEF